MKIIDIPKEVMPHQPFLKPKQRFCYWIPASGFVEGHGMRVSIIKEGTPGHFPTGEWPCPPGGRMPWFWGDAKDPVKALLQAELCCFKKNASLGLSEDDVQNILLSTIANPA